MNLAKERGSMDCLQSSPSCYMDPLLSSLNNDGKGLDSKICKMTEEKGRSKKSFYQHQHSAVLIAMFDVLLK